MFSNPYLLAIITAAGIAVWPVMVKASGVNFAWAMIIVYMAPFLTGLLSLPGSTFPSLAGTLVLLAAACVMAIIASSHMQLILLAQQEISRNLPLVSALVPVMILIGGVFFLGETLTIKKIFGILAIVSGVLLLRQ